MVLMLHSSKPAIKFGGNHNSTETFYKSKYIMLTARDIVQQEG